jgi:hypothetical protein
MKRGEALDRCLSTVSLAGVGLLLRSIAQSVFSAELYDNVCVPLGYLLSAMGAALVFDRYCSVSRRRQMPPFWAMLVLCAGIGIVLGAFAIVFAPGTKAPQ